MKKWLMIAIVACAPACVVAQSTRCADKIISRGTSRAEVAALCGDPAQIDHSSVYLAAPTAGPGFPGSATIEVQIEVWTYNFGPDKLMQRIRFEDGTVVRIESLGYGY